MVGAIDFPALIRELHSELNHAQLDGHAPMHAQAGTQPVTDDGWQSHAHEVVRNKLHSPFEFLEWAKRDRHWSFTLAELMGKVCAKPSELAIRLFVAILEELREEQQTLQPAAE
jgi:hypothetical protein